MWLSRKVQRQEKDVRTQKGRVTISSPERIEAGSTVSEHNIGLCQPYGYSARPPVGEEVFIIQSSDGQAVAGVRSEAQHLDSGEIRLKSKGGATLILRNDGSVEINSLVIDKNGVMKK